MEFASLSTNSASALEIERHAGVDGIAESCLQGFFQRRCTHTKNPWPVENLKDVRRHQCLKLPLAKRSFQKSLGGPDVVANELLWIETNDLRMADHKMSAPHKLLLPWGRLCEIRLNNSNLRVKPAKSSGIHRMFI